MSRGRAWSAHDIEWLRENWERPDAELYEHLSRPVGSIRSKRRELGLIGKPGHRKADWSQEEIDYLQEVWGEKTIPQIAKRLGRSINAVKVKSVRLGFTAQKWYGSMMSARKVSELLGVDVHTVTDYWIPKCGLKGRKKLLGEKGHCTIVYFEDLLRWLKNNQDKWDSRRVELFSLGEEPDWLKEKRKADLQKPKRKAQKWTRDEDLRVIFLFKTGQYTVAQIAEQLGRPFSGVEHRLLRLDVWGTGEYIGNKRQEEKQKRKEEFEKRALQYRFITALKTQFNKLNFDGYWQKDMCMLWNDMNGCTAGESDCDNCTSFQRIREQWCRRCWSPFLERETNTYCFACRKARIKEAQRKWARESRRSII